MKVARRAAAEALGSAFLLATVVGSGIMGERLSGGNVALALLANAVATGGGLLALILTFGPISGAHFNPVVTLAFAATGQHPRHEVLPYVAAQLIGAVLGVWAAHLMFGESVLQVSTKLRPGIALGWSEFVATLGLVTVILSGARHRADTVPYAVAAYIVGAYWFTASTSFANPAVTIARALSDTFAGIAPSSVPAFIAAQLLALAIALALHRWMHAEPQTRSSGLISDQSSSSGR
jgi:glycerol uptake facilitator-like aquaporin